MVKTCTRCGDFKPLASFYRNIRAKDRLCSHCAECDNKKSARYRSINAERLKQKRKAYTDANREGRAAYYKKWREKNRERIKIRKAEYYQSHKEHESRRNTAYDKKWRAANRDRRKAYEAKYRKDNKSRVTAHANKRRCRKAQATPTWADFTLITAFYEQCARITAETGVKHHVDHIVPLSSPVVCGLHCQNNLQILPEAANKRKGNRIWPDMP
ncbi:hypothetical protein [Fimbriiglobus ruber]|uniref:hypothetical protein n=1 Tax=Fimbriiglobus ruber TaxID=1908690 RepID=UPI00117B1259|nr:hypothetical protein [Fimbriiglobus ruber]